MRDADPLERYAPRLLAAFNRYLRWYFSRHFNSLLVLRDAPAPTLERGQILYANHPSWWDPMTLLIFAATGWPKHRVFAPIEAPALERYSILGRLGFFPVDASRIGRRRFLRVADRVLAAPDASLALTPQGRFADPRERPIRFEPGLAHLLRANPSRRAIPIAIEYGHWFERLPESLLAFGEPIAARKRETRASLARRLELALEQTADRLAHAAATRDAGQFSVVLASRRRGAGGFYDAYERARALARGRAFDPSHRAVGNAARR